MSKSVSVIVAVILGIIVGGGGVYFLKFPSGVQTGVETTVQRDKKILYWKAPMDPNYISDEPGKSPMGMDLIPVYEGADDGAEPGTVSIDPVIAQNIGVRTAEVKRMTLTKSLRTIGRVDYDEKRVYHVNTKVDGWIEKLYVDYTGQEVGKGDRLLEIYSPKLVAAQEEYLLARQYGETISGVGRDSISGLSRRRLELWDVPEAQIKELEERGTVTRTLRIDSPVTGIVTKKSIQEGMYVKPGMLLYTIADISRVWVYADIYEYEIPWIKVGQKAEMTLVSYPGKVFKGKVTFIYPFMEAKTRTNKVRLEFANPGFKLKPDMYANVTLYSVVSRSAVAVPAEAVIRSGERNIVLVARGGGKFSPRPVTLGVEAGGYYEVRAGLEEGDEVVISAQFLIDSESRLKEAITKMLEVKKGGAADNMETDGMDPGKTKGMEGMDHGKMDGMKGMDRGPGKTKGMEGMDHSGM
jgi:multidrug efflux pump subunit AcrA (membrane-fusion protein)